MAVGLRDGQQVEKQREAENAGRSGTTVFRQENGRQVCMFGFIENKEFSLKGHQKVMTQTHGVSNGSVLLCRQGDGAHTAGADYNSPSQHASPTTEI